MCAFCSGFCGLYTGFGLKEFWAHGVLVGGIGGLHGEVLQQTIS